jgi:regulator of sigma E protease
MSEFFGSVWWLLVTLGLLVTFHEYGHFVVARKLGVKVLRFSVGFGRALWSRVGKDGTEYVVAAIPLGGYVKMLDEREGEVADKDLPGSFNRKPVGSRIAIVAAGPIANLVFAVAAFWLMFVIGKPDYLPIVGKAEAQAQAAGFVAGDTIKRVDGRDVRSWSEAAALMAGDADLKRRAEITVVDTTGAEHVRRLDFDPKTDAASFTLHSVGLYAKQMLLAPIVGEVAPGTPAERAGIKPGDRVVSIDGKRIAFWDEVATTIAADAKAGVPMTLVLERGDDRISVDATPESLKNDDGTTTVRLGIGGKRTSAEYDALLRYGPLDAVPAAFAETWHMTGETFALNGRMVTGKAALKNLSGPISFARYANASAKLGVAWFLFFLAVLSLSIAIMNLLPIPVLDGGHLLYYLIELAKGSPLSERAMAMGQYAGLALLAGLMGLAFYNDLLGQIP